MVQEVVAMAQSLSLGNEGGGLDYDHIRTHLAHARAAAEHVGDKAVLTLIDKAQQLCGNDSGAAKLSEQVHSPAEHGASSGALSVYLFGTFQAYLNGSLVNGWRKKSESLFKYLVVHRASPIHRDQLLNTFWPDATPQAARNCLNVTLHALRHSLKLDERLSSAETLIYAEKDNHYALHPDLHIWTDVGTFAEELATAQLLARRGDSAGAIRHYEAAATLYRGDLLEADRYEDWAINHRERVRNAYLELLTELGRLYFEAGNYFAALDINKKIVERDNCYEDAHCQIMRCYYALSRRGLAMRQYTICRDTLARELDVAPMEATTRLYEAIKTGSF
jgi:DNA-binding SARP family transcriptional activator